MTALGNSCRNLLGDNIIVILVMYRMIIQHDHCHTASSSEASEACEGLRRAAHGMTTRTTELLPKWTSTAGVWVVAGSSKFILELFQLFDFRGCELVNT